MKLSYLTLSILLLTGYSDYAQNIFPSTGPVGVGTTGPIIPLQIHTGAGSNVINEGLRIVNQFNSNGNNNPSIVFSNDGSNANPLTTTFQTWALSAMVAGGESFSIIHKGGTNALITPFFINGANGSVGINTTYIPSSFQFAVNGAMITTSIVVKVRNGWPDYVFKKDYQLPSLQEVKAYIDQNQHLPEIPSEQQIAKDGLNLGEMNKLLMKKMEELTLYLIDEHKKNKDQQEQIDQLNKKIELLINKIK
ncbi:hypothetical protein SAMN05428975_5911 [Mucilaginibacter sp. OK268]|jgi:hypothetical protein|uniref:hypothetical protein n=1 Tax=Mucilaginibacter sp. OK268 TaxID=1881048 RepID=UPI0008831B5A|nr:hypothetical protein [Mucilaginibacter sp. OK268]SDQ01647.1 hypothetical protein SAMN05428975_5911 [Mucilaginibacter sp. OK268]